MCVVSYEFILSSGNRSIEVVVFRHVLCSVILILSSWFEVHNAHYTMTVRHCNISLFFEYGVFVEQNDYSGFKANLRAKTAYKC